MTTPSVRVGDRVRFRGCRLWWRVTRVPNARGVQPENRIMECTHPRAQRMRPDRRHIVGWVEDVADRRRP